MLVIFIYKACIDLAPSRQKFQTKKIVWVNPRERCSAFIRTYQEFMSLILFVQADSSTQNLVSHPAIVMLTFLNQNEMKKGHYRPFSQDAVHSNFSADLIEPLTADRFHGVFILQERTEIRGARIQSDTPKRTCFHVVDSSEDSPTRIKGRNKYIYSNNRTERRDRESTGGERRARDTSDRRRT
jgi:hypothetical protein